tara:strand:+ start:923 stop:1408 length:486 start_codon:yes stop_codon:yes gene_type:complete
MIDDIDVEGTTDFRQGLCDGNVAFAGIRISTWMIVYKDQSGSIEFHSTSKDSARIKCQLPERTNLQLLIGDQMPRAVKKYDPQDLVGQSAHRSHQILKQIGAVWTDRKRSKFLPHSFKEHQAGAQQYPGDGCMTAKHTLQRLGALSEDAPEATKFVEEGVC